MNRAVGKEDDRGGDEFIRVLENASYLSSDHQCVRLSHTEIQPASEPDNTSACINSKWSATLNQANSELTCWKYIGCHFTGAMEKVTIPFDPVSESVTWYVYTTVPIGLV